MPTEEYHYHLIHRFCVLSETKGIGMGINGTAQVNNSCILTFDQGELCNDETHMHICVTFIFYKLSGQNNMNVFVGN